MQIVTLITDWGNGDYYLGCLKGHILSLCPSVTFADITHHIQPFNTLQASLILRNTYAYFPQGTIHIVGVNSEPSPTNPITVIQANGHYFIGSNDGMFSLIIDEEPDEVIQLNNLVRDGGFKADRLFAITVKAIVHQIPLTELGTACEMKKEPKAQPVYDGSSISGLVGYIDSFGNAITNISRDLFERVGQGRSFEILVQNNFTKITTISEHYDDVRFGRLVAVFNSFNMLEVAINRGNIAQLENLDIKSSVRIKFFDE